MEKLNTSILKTKQHFEILDGLRGVAAMAVVTFHFMEMAYSDYGQNFISHGFLAVDFFFCLSGFVIAYAYDDRIAKMGMLEFFKSRLIRLHPLVIFGSILGLLAFLFDPFGGHIELYSAGKIVLVFITSILLIPFPLVADRAFNLFSYNAPAWSLFWEYVANIFYALILCRLQKSFLIVLAIISAAFIFYIAHHAGNLMGGWSWGTFWDGCARVSYSFLAGMAVYRFNFIIKNKLGFIGLSVLLVLAFLMPFSNKWNWLSEPLVVILYFPLLVALGAGAILTTGLRKLCVLSGKLSYPLYMTHYTVMWMFGNYYANHKPGTGQLTLIIISGLIILPAFAYLVMVLYDQPVRNYLSRKREQRN
ncbi:acyltransferase [Mucilaginibacter sp. BT774]|uniref:acyltransferase family protein n=1 Tax=Mucilaginibacter sp. BT774 TaxID=3062276 RepID=UPI002674A592|nr:acyltransferase [Mucilaginibacter sp. BT774]MDO3629112.1 acyltransferase [Mucilaginibacter sp. BT774]